jgi:RNA polymerase sigma-70 factor (ECF subfamily)
MVGLFFSERLFSEPETTGALGLFERHGAMVYRRCRQLMGSDDAAKDAVQEVFLRVVQRRAQFRGDASPVTWLYAIATLHCLQQLRNQRRRGERAAVEAEEPEPSLAPTLDERLSVEAVLALEDEQVRAMVVLRYVDQLELEEIAQALGCSRKTVTRKLQRFLVGARVHLTEGAMEP